MTTSANASEPLPPTPDGLPVPLPADDDLPSIPPLVQPPGSPPIGAAVDAEWPSKVAGLVQLAALPDEYKPELISELLAARDSAGLPLTTTAICKRLSALVAEYNWRRS